MAKQDYTPAAAPAPEGLNPSQQVVIEELGRAIVNALHDSGARRTTTPPSQAATDAAREYAGIRASLAPHLVPPPPVY